VFRGGWRDASNWLTSMLRIVLDSSIAGLVDRFLDAKVENAEPEMEEVEMKVEEEGRDLPSGLYFFRVSLCFFVLDGRSGEFDRERELTPDRLKAGDRERDRERDRGCDDAAALDLVRP